MVALINLLFERYSNDAELHVKIPSILYMFYIEQIVSEEFLVKYLIKRDVKYQSFLYSEKLEGLFLKAARQFTHWLENAPYEDETDKVYVPESEEKKNEAKAIDNL